MVFNVALYVPWCRHLESLPAIKPQLYADNLKYSALCPSLLLLGSLLSMLGLSVRVSHLGSVFSLSTSKAVLEGHEALGHLWES